MSYLKETVYSPNADKMPIHVGIYYALKGLYNGRSLGYRLFRRNISSQYRQSLLGIFWAFVPVIVTSAVWMFLQGSRIINIADPGMPYPAFVLIGTTLWQGFLTFLQGPLNMVNGNKGLLVKINFQREALLVAAFYDALFNFMIRLPVIIVAMLIFNVVPGVNLIYFPLALIALFLLGASISLLLLPLSMLYTDINRAIGTIAQFLMYLTPVIYPFPKDGLAADLMKLNPIAPVLSTARNTLGTEGSPFMEGFWLISGISLVLFFFGLILYRKSMPHIIARIGA
ncbi:MAG: ABC transporter permease [Bacteroidota bacterium]